MDLIRGLITDLQNRLEKIEKGLIIKRITIPSDDTGSFSPKVVSTDPSSPKPNEWWINSSSGQIKWNNGGTIVVWNL